MTPHVLERFEHLICDLPEWEKEDDRRALLRGILQHLPVWSSLNLKGAPKVAAGALIETCNEQDPESLCVLLSGLRKPYKSHPQRLSEIEFLAANLCAGQTRRRGPWTGSPYLGLAYFDRQHAPLFFGREAALKQLVHTLNKQQGQCFSVIVGASGSGKSSLVRAGLWARLARGEIVEMSGSKNWLISTMTPTDSDNPMTALRASALAAAQEDESFRSQCDWRKEIGAMKGSSISALAERLLLNAPPEARWLVILDQMEELFAADMKEEGAAFLDQLIEATQPPSRVRVVATLRADFFQHSLLHPRLNDLLNREGGQFVLGPPARRSLEQMVSGPLTEVELVPDDGDHRPWYLDPELPATIAADAERHVGGLALMAFALRELYDACRPTHHLDVATYQGDFGGLSGSIARKANSIMASLGEAAEPGLPRVFVRLVHVNEKNEPTRRRQPLSAWKNDADALVVIHKFQEARLLVADRGDGDDPVVEVAHEALLREWPKLAIWIGERREAFKLKDRLLVEASLWIEGFRKHHQTRPYEAHRIDEYRQQLDRAGVLELLLENEDAVLLLTPEVDWILNELEWPETTPIRRRDIGQSLSQIGDPRPGVGVKDRVPDILWRSISGGSVEIQGHGDFLIEPFQMAAYPITLAQFRAFLDAKDGYDDKRWWKDLKQEGRGPIWESPLSNFPVTAVSWFDAMAFCRWLTVQRQFGSEVRLPDEQEWQWAAQSEQQDYLYPWGPEWLDGRANTAESYINSGTAVGLFPQGDSLQQVSDLAGNIWEWCRNEYANPHRVEPGGEEYRVLRGGSWVNGRNFARAAARDDGYPGARVSGIGFRVVVSSPPKP